MYIHHHLDEHEHDHDMTIVMTIVMLVTMSIEVSFTWPPACMLVDGCHLVLPVHMYLYIDTEHSTVRYPSVYMYEQ